MWRYYQQNKMLSVYMLKLKLLLLTTFILILPSCASNPSIIEITESDLLNFDLLLNRPGEEVRFFPSYDKTNLAVTVLHPKSELKGIVLFIHGVAARSKLYLPLADELNQSGFAVYLLDLRGHGWSQGEPGIVPNKNSISKDVSYFYQFVISQNNNNLPMFGMGHSMGTFIWVNTLAQTPEIKLNGLVLLSGGIYPDRADDLPKENKNRDFVYYHPISLIGSIFSKKIKPIEIILPNIPMKEYSGFVFKYHPSFFSMFIGAEKRFNEFYNNTNVPIFFISGSEDEVIKVDDIQYVYDLTYSKNTQIKILDEVTHTSIIWYAAPHIIDWIKTIGTRI